MTIFIEKQGVDCKEFYKIYLPLMMGEFLKSCYDKYKSRYIKIDDELQDSYGVTSRKILDDFVDFIYLSENKQYYIYQIDNNIPYDNNYKYIDMFNLIDNGNMNVKGIGLTTKLKQFLNDNFKSLYDTFMFMRLGGEGYVNRTI